MYDSLLGTSHNLSWRGGGGGGEIGDPSIFLGWGLKMPKDDLGGGFFKFLLSSIPTE